MAHGYADDPVAGVPVDPRALARRAWLPLLTGLTLLLGFGMLLVLPYLVNDLHHLSLAELASGRHDPKELWPGTGPGGYLLGAAAMVLLALGPLLAVAAAGWSAAALVVRRRVLDARTRVLLLGAVVLPAAFLVLFFSPFGSALVAWTMD